jgi:hypothetical protein
MALTYTYPDAYLAKFATEDRETRAIADVALMAGTETLSDDWTERLVITQVYIIACLENQADTEDLFTAKLKSYRQQLDVQLPQAIAAARSEAGTISNIGLMSIPLERS